jgi:hypothetical protein
MPYYDTTDNAINSLTESFRVLCEWSTPHSKQLNIKGNSGSSRPWASLWDNPYAEPNRESVWWADDYRDNGQTFGHADKETNVINTYCDTSYKLPVAILLLCLTCSSVTIVFLTYIRNLSYQQNKSMYKISGFPPGPLAGSQYAAGRSSYRTSRRRFSWF